MLHSWTSSSSSGSTSSTRWVQLFTGCRSGTRPPASIAVPAATRSGDAEPAVSASAVSAVRRQVRPAGARPATRPAPPGGRRWCGRSVTQLGQRPGRQRCRLGRDQRRVRAGRAAHGLGGVVDQDVQRALLGHRVGQRDHLGRVAQVDADDPQPVQPVGAVGHRGEPAHRVVGEPGGDRGVRAVAQQPQRDVHADLRAPAGEQGAAPGQVGAGVPAGAVQRRAGRAELVVERVDLPVLGLADVAGPRPRSASPAERAGGGGQPAGCPGSRRRSGPASRWRSRATTARSAAAIGVALVRAALLLDRLEHLRGRPADGDAVGMVLGRPRAAGPAPAGRSPAAPGRCPRLPVLDRRHIPTVRLATSQASRPWTV